MTGDTTPVPLSPSIKLDRKLCSPVLFTFYCNVATLFGYNGLCHGKPDTHVVFWCVFAFVKAVKDIGEVLFINPRAAVSDGDHCIKGVLGKGDIQLSLFRGMFNTVLDNIYYSLTAQLKSPVNLTSFSPVT